MLGRTHVVVGVAWGAWYAAALPGAPDAIRFAAAAVVAVAALYPDIDHHAGTITRSLGPLTGAVSWVVRRFVTHRGVLHRPITAVWAALAAVPVAVPGAALLGHVGWWWALAAALGLGWACHLAVDARTHSGIPYGRGGQHRLRLGRTLRTGSPAEHAYRARWVRIAGVSALAAWVLTMPAMPLGTA